MPFGSTPVGFGAPAPAPAPAPAQAPGFGAAPAPAAGGPIGVSFQCEMKDSSGAAINFFLHFGPEHVTSLEAIGALAGQLLAANIPLKVWQPKQGGNSFSNRGGGNGYGGGYGRGGGFR